MKKVFLIFLITICSTNIFAANEQYSKYNGSSFYISNIGSAGLYRYFTATETVAIAKLTGVTDVFCAIATLSNPTDLLVSDSLSNGQYLYTTAPLSDMYIGVCVKSSGTDGNNIVAFDKEYNVTRSNRRESQQRNIEMEEKIIEYIRTTLE